MIHLLHDLQVAVRTFVRRPGFTLLAAGTLALGIAAHAALFSVVDGVLLRPPDLPRADELVIVRQRSDGEFRNMTGPNAVDVLRGSGRVFVDGAAFWGASATLRNPDGTREVRSGVGATTGVFETLGIPLQLGRPWEAHEVGTGALAALVISDGLWRSRFGGDAGIVGRTIEINGSPVRVAGVMAAGFRFPTLETADFVFPPVADPAGLQRAGLGAFTLLARRGPGVTLETAREEVERVWEGVRAEHPGDLREDGVAVMGLHDYLVRDARPTLVALVGATSLLLLLACANVSNLLLAQGLRRGPEMSIRAALGAGRGRLAGQMLVESAVVAAIAGVAGVLLGMAMLGLARRVAPPGMTGIDALGMSPRAIVFAVSIALICALVVGVLPGLRASAARLRSGTRASAGKGLRRLQNALVVAQIASAVMLANGAGLLARSFDRLSDVDPGYRTAGVLTASIGVPFDLYGDRASRAAFFERVEREVSAVPGVERVGTTLRAPFSSGEISVPVRLADAATLTAESAPRVELGIVSPGYLAALEIPLLRGRSFTEADRPDGTRVALLSESLARALYGDADPVGRRLAPLIGARSDAPIWAEVVGVVGDIRLESLDASAVGTLYLATAQMPQPGGTLVVRTEGDAARLTGPVRDALFRAEPGLLVPTFRTLADLRAESLARPRFQSLLVGAFSLLALAISAVGIYGLLSYSVAGRGLEFGVRAAVGASRAALLRLVFAQGMALAGLGLLIGTAGAWAGSRVLSALLFGIETTDGPTYGATLVVVLTIVFASCLLPALRASRRTGVEALRGDG